MQRVVVTIRRTGEPDGSDLEVPAEVPARSLGELIAGALGWDQPDSGQAARATTYEIKAEPPGRALGEDETLADAEAWDGAILELTPVWRGADQAPRGRGNDPARASNPPFRPSPPAGGPLEGFEDLGIRLPGAPEETPPTTEEQRRKKPGYVFKQVD